MSPPDLDTDEGRAAYRRELRLVARPLRWTALSLIVVSAAVIYAMSRGMLVLPQLVLLFAYACLAFGWGLVVTTIFLRNRHHRRRMAELAGLNETGAVQ